MPSSSDSITFVACSASSSDVACCSFVFNSWNLSNNVNSSAFPSNNLQENGKKIYKKKILWKKKSWKVRRKTDKSLVESLKDLFKRAKAAWELLQHQIQIWCRTNHTFSDDYINLIPKQFIFSSLGAPHQKKKHINMWDFWFNFLRDCIVWHQFKKKSFLQVAVVVMMVVVDLFFHSSTSQVQDDEWQEGVCLFQFNCWFPLFFLFLIHLLCLTWPLSNARARTHIMNAGIFSMCWLVGNQFSLCVSVLSERKKANKSIWAKNKSWIAPNVWHCFW